MFYPTHCEPVDPLDMTHEIQIIRDLDAADVRDGVASRVLRMAAAYLVQHGWTQGSYYDHTDTLFTPAACLVGAIGMVCYGGPVDAPALNHDDPGFQGFDEAVTYLGRYLVEVDNSIEDVYTFNDAKGRTLDEVIAAIEAAADRWDHDNGESPVLPYADYPHEPGTLYDCPACEAVCFCLDGFDCGRCAVEAEDPWSNFGGAA